ncbi:alpha-L-rhamnosidase [Hymenobacter sp. GOD-10R]|uniref:alpha-L-rhamnosidase n=1 Tax=Hymenobacter sp. GOD-10R TaxID=3093922 RepID=UPI002D769009|nr:family 78 glycoside hydrolase catalytic domain [Hymenobacter sp. GOD-10R]WRQ30257.1 family 78 glycoside hydrolase catalytic domain [Hymenobacter sp. GOD-10R]
MFVLRAKLVASTSSAFSRCILGASLLLVSLSAQAYTPAGAVDLRCEYLVNPLGLDAPRPRLSWRLDDNRRGARQQAYQLVVGTDSLSVSQGKGAVWNPGKIASDQQLVTYAGQALRPFTKYFWRVQVWNGGNAPASRVASFETGLMTMKNWQGTWISDTRDVALRPAPYFRKGFGVAKKVKSARAYIAAAGLYELFLNGQRIGNHRLDPMYTRFDRRTLYVTYDVTSYLKAGQNAVGVLLGNGWYNHQSTAVWYFHEAPWRNRPTFCLDLRVTYTDGSVETVTSGIDWKTSLGPLVFNSIYTAEHYDARLEQTGWNTAGFDDTKWKPVMNRAAPSQNIVAQVMHPIRNVESIPAKTIKKLNDTTYVFDLGRNIAGVSQLRVQGPAGTALRLKHGERVYADGRVDQSNIDVHYRPTDKRDPFQTDVFTLSGKGEETFMPSFNYKGFQYVEVTSSQPVALTTGSLTGYFMHSDVPAVGQVSSSNPTLNKIWQATNNSYLSNLFGYPTDCPQREKNGWTGDAHIAVETGLYNFDGITVYEKWLADHRDEQQPNGVLPSIIPSNGWGYEWGNGPDWTSTIALIPWNIYLFYGDTKLLADCYGNLKRYVDHIHEQSPTNLTSWGLGDWVPVKSKSPVELTSSTYYYTDALILAKAAKVLGKTADYTYYAALAEKIRAAINAKYLNRETAQYGNGVQTELSVPLYWGVVPPELKSRVADNLARRVAADNYHLDVGLLGTKAILSALSENGHADLAYRVAAQETFPSWGWWIVNGATTLYENWPIDAKSDISMNHIMFGEIGAWLYKGLGGIRPDPLQPGFKNTLLTPHFVAGLDHFEASHASPYGLIRSAWQKIAGSISYKVTVPPNATATLLLPVASGQQVYEAGKRLDSASPYIRLVKSTPGLYQYHLAAGSYELAIR